MFEQVQPSTTVARARHVIRYKSAQYTVEQPLLLGGSLGGAPPELLAGYSAFGLALGEAFQLRDDVLGVFGDPTETGKPAGDDLREGKRTYLVAAAFAGSHAATRAELRAGLGDPELNEAGVERLRGIIVDSGALERAEQRIANLTEAALRALGRVRLAGDASLMLVDLAQQATRRSV